MLGASRRARRASRLALSLCAGLALVGGHAPGEPTESGAIHGHVKLLRKKLFGTPEAEAEVRDVVVYVTGFAGRAPAAEASLDQRGEQFRPRLLPIVVGQTVEFPNRDRIYHNVFSVSPAHAFDLGQYKSSDPPKRERFDRPGLVPVYCNIHPHMIAYVAVLENSAFALAATDGSFSIQGVPPGRHVVRAFSPGADPVQREVEVVAGSAAEIELELIAGAIPTHKRKDGSEYPPPGSDAER
jgi:plastocyanin